MQHVTAFKLRSRRPGPSPLFRGVLFEQPVVGRPLVLVSSLNGDSFSTSVIRRILNDTDSRVLFIQTKNSVYRVRFEAPPMEWRLIFECKGWP